MRLVVDGVAFQLGQRPSSRVWSSLLPRLAAHHDIDLFLLDRGASPVVSGAKLLHFPSYNWTNTAADSMLIEQFCQSVEADVFMSTYYTTPITVPSVMLVYDDDDRRIGEDRAKRAMQERMLALSFNSYFACASKHAQAELMRRHRALAPELICLNYLGFEPSLFQPRSQSAVEQFKKDFGLAAAYCIVMIDSDAYSDAATTDQLPGIIGDGVDFILLCGAPSDRGEFSGILQSGTSIRRFNLNDEDLACAYSGAEALVYLHSYGDFSGAIVEAMACGCPVIVTSGGIGSEIGADAAVSIPRIGRDELQRAFSIIRDQESRKRLIESGFRRSAVFNWDTTVDKLYDLLRKAQQERETESMKRFHDRWQKLRSIQAETDASVNLDFLYQGVSSSTMGAACCTAAKMLTPLGKRVPILASWASGLQKMGVEMWNRANPL